MSRYNDDRSGAWLWGYNLWTRAYQLHDLAAYFRSVGVINQAVSRPWAQQAEFNSDFEGRVCGLGTAVFQLAGDAIGVRYPAV